MGVGWGVLISKNVKNKVFLMDSISEVVSKIRVSGGGVCCHKV